MPEDLRGSRHVEAGTVWPVLGQGIPHIAGRDQGREGGEVRQAVRVALAILAFMVMGDGMDDREGAVLPEAGSDLSAVAGVVLYEGVFLGGQGSWGVQDGV